MKFRRNKPVFKQAAQKRFFVFKYSTDKTPEKML